jgi:predicted DNA-binding transcriptional regulator AlpA
VTHAPYLTSREAVQYLGLPSVNALKQRMKRGTIPTWCWTRMGGKSLRFVRAALDEWLQPADRTGALALVAHGQQVNRPRVGRRGHA